MQRKIHIQATPPRAGRHLLGAVIGPRDTADLSRCAVRPAPDRLRLRLRPIPVPLSIQLIHAPGHIPTLHGFLDRHRQDKLPRQRLQGAQVHATRLQLVGGLQAIGRTASLQTQPIAAPRQTGLGDQTQAIKGHGQALTPLGPHHALQLAQTVHRRLCLGLPTQDRPIQIHGGGLRLTLFERDPSLQRTAAIHVGHHMRRLWPNRQQRQPGLRVDDGRHGVHSTFPMSPGSRFRGVFGVGPIGLQTHGLAPSHGWLEIQTRAVRVALSTQHRLHARELDGVLALPLVGPEQAPATHGQFGLSQQPACASRIALVFGADVQARHPPATIGAVPHMNHGGVHHDLLKALVPQRHEAQTCLQALHLKSHLALCITPPHVARDPDWRAPPTAALSLQGADFHR